MKKLTLLLACLLSMGLAIGQNRPISGTVVDETGEPVIGASVFARGTTAGTVTDINGKFSFSVPVSANTLVVKYVGYADVEVAANANVSVKLTRDAKLLDEVVVSAMGIQRPERSLGNTKTIVDPNNAVLKAEPDLFRSLNGKIPGVNIAASSAVAGSATKVNIRGNSSFYGSNDPLYVVDGVPYSNVEITTGNR